MRDGVCLEWKADFCVFATLTWQLAESLPKMIQGVMSDDLDAQLDSTTKFRKLLSKEKSPPIDKVISCGVVPRFVEFLRSPHSPLQVSRHCNFRRFPLLSSV